MTIAQLDDIAVKRLCNGIQEAVDWIQLGRVYCHEIDDLIDEDLPKALRQRGAQRACRIGAMAIDLYTHPFFLKNMATLKAAMKTCTHQYAESVAWEESQVEWQKNYADWARHSWLDVCLTVAEICGGWDHRVSVAEELRTVSYVDHHEEGKPT